MEENNNQNQQQYQQYQAPQQQGAAQGNQFFQGFVGPNTEEGLKKIFKDLKTSFIVLGILGAISVVFELMALGNPFVQLAMALNGGFRAFCIIDIIAVIGYAVVCFVGIPFSSKEDKKALILGIVAGALLVFLQILSFIFSGGFKWITIAGIVLIVECVIALNKYKAVRGNR